jgi:hypothetical protein
MFKLGKLPKKHDPRTLRLARYVQAMAPPPDAANYSAIPGLGMMLNDNLGDCVCAGYGHAVQQWNLLAGHPFDPADSDVLTSYEAIGKYVPDDPLNPQTNATDQGCDMLTACQYWRATGMAGHTVDSFASLGEETPIAEALIRQSIYLFGNSYFGFAMPVSAQNQTIWDVVPDPGDGSAAAGSWGGHCVLAVAYDDEGITVFSWGAVYKVTWAFVETYADEAYALWSEDWLAFTGQSLPGFDKAALAIDMGNL